MIGWPSCCLRLNTAEAQPRQIKLIDKNIDRPNRIVLAQIVIQSLGKQRALTAIIPNDKARHRILPANHQGMISFRSVFTQAGPVSEVGGRNCDVRSTPENGLNSDIALGPFSARSGNEAQSLDWICDWCRRSGYS